MGNGIVRTFAQGGYSVVMKDLSDELLRKAVGNIDNSLSRLVAKDKLDEADKRQILARIRCCAKWSAPTCREEKPEPVFTTTQNKTTFYAFMKRDAGKVPLLPVPSAP